MKKSALFIIIAVFLLIAAITVTFFIIIGKTDVNTLEFTLFDKKGANLLAVESNDGKWGFINKKGEEIIQCKYDDVWPFSNGLAAVCESGVWRYINTKGMVAINENYDRAYPFDEKGYAVVMKDGKYGVINKRGDFKISNEFEALSPFNEFDLALAKKGGLYGIINRKGEAVVSFKYKLISDFSEDGYAAIITTDGKCGIIDKSGEETVAPIYETCYRVENKDTFISGMLMVSAKNENGENLFGYVNKKGEEVIAPQYESAHPFSDNGLAPVCIKDENGNKLWGYINKEGETVIAPIYENAYGFSDNGLAKVMLNGKWGCIDKDGELKIQNIYDDIGMSEFSDSLLTVESNGRKFIINMSEEPIIDEEYQSATIDEKHIIIVFDDGQHMLYDHKGEAVNREIYDNISPLQFGYFRVLKDDKNAVVDSDGAVITHYVSDKTFVSITKDDYILATSSNGKPLILDMEGNVTVNTDKYKALREYNYVLTNYFYTAFFVAYNQ